MSNIDDFNAIVGVVFGKLYESFPIPRPIYSLETVIAVFQPKAPDLPPEKLHQRTISQWLDGDETPEEKEDRERCNVLYSVFSAAMDWLKHEGFIRTPEQDSLVYTDVVLSMKGLQSLSMIPAGLEAPIGQQLLAETKRGSVKGVGDLAKRIVGEWGPKFLAETLRASLE